VPPGQQEPLCLKCSLHLLHICVYLCARVRAHSALGAGAGIPEKGCPPAVTLICSDPTSLRGVPNVRKHWMLVGMGAPWFLIHAQPLVLLLPSPASPCVAALQGTLSALGLCVPVQHSSSNASDLLLRDSIVKAFASDTCRWLW